MLHVIHPTAAAEWAAHLRQTLPAMSVSTDADDIDPAQVEFLVCWKPQAGALKRFTRLRAIFATGAGIDHLLSRPDLPPAVPVIRLTDAGMAQQMLEYVLFGVLYFQRDMDAYARQQADGCWQALPPRSAADTRISVLGLGAIGGVVAGGLARQGFRTRGWSRGPHILEGVECLHGIDTLNGLLSETDVLVNILPNTPETAGLLDATRLSALPTAAVVINAGRGEQLDLAALLALLDADKLRGALLDVFPHEPLPPDSPLWRHPKVRVTPHIAAATLIGESAQQIADKLAALQRGEPVSGLVDRTRAY